ncbi:synaptobrevin domain-containing protein [Gonapodya prolifera JEL478]|uniref:Synaptobrevin homolog YKT6 n=1 Tax=Gonapodya prolifera (strain JEL478) TaxID=1344416 RepID=A0A138ZYW4_GONPJ|nr:synaptobrevin domain-containing protein [Gonapodya prolifera JEL478]|eukprot:KXS09702.1 synaptobrevin domain-containing protein [Gonapodya prolifera JEL478]
MPGGIIYAIVSRGTVILSEFATSTGNFQVVTQRILEKIPATGDSKLTYVFDRYLFHYIAKNGIVFMCMADDSFGRRIPFAFLEDIKTKFEMEAGDTAQSAPPYGLQSFSKVLDQQMEFFNTNPNADRFRQVRGEIDQVKNVMVHNIERVLERGERIEDLVDKTSNLNSQSFGFRKGATLLRRQMWWKNSKLVAILIVVSLLLLYFIVAMACGFPGWQNCVHRPN